MSRDKSHIKTTDKACIISSTRLGEMFTWFRVVKQLLVNMFGILNNIGI